MTSGRPAGKPAPGTRPERRSGTDRRKKEGKAPHGERRRAVEPRKPEIIELELSADEWAALHLAHDPDRRPG